MEDQIAQNHFDKLRNASFCVEQRGGGCRLGLGL